MKIMKYIRFLCFLMILTLAVGYAFHCYSFPKSYVSRSYEAFYDEPENSVDGVVFGTSVVAGGWSAPVAWYEYGMPVYQLGGSLQPFGPLPELIDFVRSRQDIKYVIIDIHSLRTTTMMKSIKPENVMRVSSCLHFGAHRYKALQSALTYVERVYAFYGMPQDPKQIISKNDISNYIPFINLHNRWVDGLEKADYVSVPGPYKGALDERFAFRVKDVSDLIGLWDLTPTQIDAFQKEILDEFFSYLNESGLDVLFINYPSFNTEDELRQMKAISQYIKDHNYDMLDLCSSEILEKTGLDTSRDFRDERHLNSSGAYKITRYISSYVKDNYYYKDHRGDAEYESWNQAAVDYSRYLEKGWAKKGVDFNFAGED